MQSPDRKVTVGLFSLSLMTILAWVSKQFFGIEIPAEIALAGATIITFGVQYGTPNKVTLQETA